ncbi:hypothetical protein BCR44DRAFT_1115643 [Catenaria anguillulae PL171]|uniref:Uncharacterized protein n=1 Tax=Catenaria anguillulae PL171 TaxID=765915 RepID=A0A1Y2HLZ3_9FUNG|nr:hypothetical protein BCR44DRAFT_1115643 [Catenaria anguillulae PL171]
MSGWLHCRSTHSTRNAIEHTCMPGMAKVSRTANHERLVATYGNTNHRDAHHTNGSLRPTDLDNPIHAAGPSPGPIRRQTPPRLHPIAPQHGRQHGHGRDSGPICHRGTDAYARPRPRGKPL